MEKFSANCDIYADRFSRNPNERFAVLLYELGSALSTTRHEARRTGKDIGGLHKSSNSFNERFTIKVLLFYERFKLFLCELSIGTFPKRKYLIV